MNGILLGFSLVFYAWDNLDHVSVLLSLILINYLIGFSKNECRPVLLLGIGYNLWVLFQYKYLSAILSALQAGDSAGVLAPLGISFLIFHAISYLMDLYQGRCEPEKNLLSFALYLAFFPKVAQGPIVKYYEMREQLRFRPVVTVDRISDGLVRFIIGLGKKVLLADLLGETVTEIFGLTSYWGMDVPTAWIGCLAYTMQIYLDFSGYSDMAIGLSRMFGFRVEENFRFPYLSRSITEFWRRWHISLGSWFREYLYIPLGGNRRGNVYFNLFFVFLVTGIWHGAGILFVLWGIGHGLCVVIERRGRNTSFYQRIPNVLKWAGTMLLVSIGWLTFRLPDLDQMIRYLGYMSGNGVPGVEGYLPFTWQYYLHPRFLFLLTVSAVGACFPERLAARIKEVLQTRAEWQAGMYVAAVLIWILSFVTIVATEYSPFIYFQF